MKPERTGYTVWSPFAEDTEYFDPEGNKVELWEPIDCTVDPYLPAENRS